MKIHKFYNIEIENRKTEKWKKYPYYVNTEFYNIDQQKTIFIPNMAEKYFVFLIFDLKLTISLCSLFQARRVILGAKS